MKKITILTIMLILVLSVAACATSKKYEGTHEGLGVSCEDCHTDASKPEETKKLDMLKACVDCHGVLPSDSKVAVKDVYGVPHEVNPHYAHVGQVRCTLCHSAHSESALYCNTCHEFDVTVPDISK